MTFSPAFNALGCLCPKWWARKATWVYVNRALAWALVVSPFVQWTLKTQLARGLWLDLAILVAHASLSLKLFGLPRQRAGTQRDWSTWFGVANAGMSPRNRFLMTGWRIVTSLAWLALSAAVIALVPLSALVLAIPMLVFGFAVQLAVPVHVYEAARVALQREGVRGAWLGAALVLALFILSSCANLFR